MDEEREARVPGCERSPVVVNSSRSLRKRNLLRICLGTRNV